MRAYVSFIHIFINLLHLSSHGIREGLTALHVAAAENSTDVARFLMKHSDPSVVEIKDKQCVHFSLAMTAAITFPL